MLTLLIFMTALLFLFGIVYPIFAVIAMRVTGDRRPLRDLLRDL